jgi:hypothetical protein
MLVRLKRYGGAVSLPVLVAFGLSVAGLPAPALAQAPARTAKILYVPVQRAESVPEGVPTRVEEYFRALIEIEPRIKLVTLPSELAPLQGMAPAPEASRPEPAVMLPPLAPHPDLDRAARLAGEGRDLAKAGKLERALTTLMQAQELYGKRIGELEDFERYVDVLVWIAASFLNGGYAEEGNAALGNVLTLRPNLSVDAGEFGAKFVAAVDAAKKRTAEGPAITVVADPPEGAIYVDGRLVGTGTQVVSDLPRGKHFVRVVADLHYPAAATVTTRGTAASKVTVTLKSRVARVAKGKPAVAAEPKSRPLTEYARTGAYLESGFVKESQAAAGKTLSDYVLYSYLGRSESAFQLGLFLLDARNGELVAIDPAIIDTDLGNLQIALLDLESRLAKALGDFPRDRLVRARPALYDLKGSRPAPTPTPVAVAVPVPVPAPPPVVAQQPPAPVARATPARTYGTQQPAPRQALPPAAPAAPSGGFDELPTDFPMEDLAPAPAKVPVYKKWWLWTIVGVAVVGGATAAGVVLGTKSSKAASVTGRAQW